MEPITWLSSETINELIKASKTRATEISEILEGISIIKIEKTFFKYDDIIYKPTYRNIKNNRDLARQEFRGAIQKYLLGFFQESIIQSCNSVEAALIIIHDERIAKDMLKVEDIPHPFTFGRSRKIALCRKKGFIDDDNIKEILNKLVFIRNGLIHQFNFLSTLIILYKSELENLERLSILFDYVLQFADEVKFSDIENILQFSELEISNNILSKMRKIVGTDYFSQIAKDVSHALNVIKNLSDFKWATSKNNIKFMEKLINQFLSNEDHMEFGFDIFHYLAYNTLNDAFKILKYLQFF